MAADSSSLEDLLEALVTRSWRSASGSGTIRTKPWTV